MTTLHINTSARTTGSLSRAIGEQLVAALGQPVIERDLGRQPLPAISGEELIAVHGSQPDPSETEAKQLALSEQLIDELRRADTLVIGTAMYNFGVPAVLKQWIDAICRAGVSFRYGENGPEGLLGVKRAFIITATGGTPVGGDWDFASSYLEHICRFIGIDQVFHIDASGSKREPEQVITQARQQIDELLASQPQTGAV